MRSVTRILGGLLFLVLAAGEATALDPSQLQKKSSFVTAGGENANFKRVPQRAFSIGDRIYFLTMITWEPVGSSAGKHRLKWQWFSKGKLVAEISRKLKFVPTPFETWSTIPASALGTGDHSVKLFVDDVLFDTQEFVILESAPTSE